MFIDQKKSHISHLDEVKVQQDMNKNLFELSGLNIFLQNFKLYALYPLAMIGIFFGVLYFAKADTESEGQFFVIHVKGKLFALRNSEIKEISQGDQFKIGNRLILEDGGEMILSHTKQGKIFAKGSTQIRWNDDRSIELLNGRLWVQYSPVDKSSDLNYWSIRTPQASINFTHGAAEASILYSSREVSTQSLSIFGHIDMQISRQDTPVLFLRTGELGVVESSDSLKAEFDRLASDKSPQDANKSMLTDEIHRAQGQLTIKGPLDIGVKSFEQLRKDFTFVTPRNASPSMIVSTRKDQVEEKRPVVSSGEKPSVSRKIASLADLENSEKTTEVDNTNSVNHETRQTQASKETIPKKITAKKIILYRPKTEQKLIQTVKQPSLSPTSPTSKMTRNKVSNSKKDTVRVFRLGKNTQTQKEVSPSRIPASASSSVKSATSSSQNKFERSREKIFEQQHKHSPEVERLIDDLESFNKDYDVVY